MNAFFSKQCFQSRWARFLKNGSTDRSEILTQPSQIYSSGIDRRNKISDNYFYFFKQFNEKILVENLNFFFSELPFCQKSKFRLFLRSIPGFIYPLIESSGFFISDNPNRRYLAHRQTPFFGGPLGDRLQEQCNSIFWKMKNAEMKLKVTTAFINTSCICQIKSLFRKKS